jgi:hypothetical protein
MVIEELREAFGREHFTPTRQIVLVPGGSGERHRIDALASLANAPNLDTRSIILATPVSIRMSFSLTTFHVVQ